MVSLSKYLTVKEVASELDVTKQAVHYWINSCGLQAIKPGACGRGHKTMIERIDLIRFLSTHETIGNKYQWERLL